MTLKSVSKKRKPEKPRKDYPLFAHASGQWAKKVRGRLVYFGKWDDPLQAERNWERDKLALLEGRDPRRGTTGDSVEWLCNTFCESKKLQQERGELTERSFNNYRAVAKHITANFGKGRKLESLRSHDFERYRNSLPDSWSPSTVNGHLLLARAIFKYANDTEATDRPLRYALGLKSVPKRKVRQAAAERGNKDYTAQEVHKLIKHASHTMKAFVLLGLNAAYGPSDIGRLKRSDINLETRWLGVPRGKTGMARGAYLWPETVEAIEKALEISQETSDPKLKELAFLTRQGRPWWEETGDKHPLVDGFRQVKKKAKIVKKGTGHYGLRHTFATVASDARDQQAIDFVMGHVDNSMAANYRSGIDPERVKAVSDHVRQWFLAGGA